MIGKNLRKLLCTLGVMIGITCNTVYSSNVDSIQPRGEWTGDKKVVKPLVLLIDFNNYTFEDMKKEVTPRDFKEWGVQHYKDMCFGDEEYRGPKDENLISMREYYKEQSGGSFIVDGDVFGWYTAKKDAEYYGKRYGVTKDANIEELVKEAFDKALEDPNIDLSQYDTDKNGIVDSLVIVHAGKGEEVGGGTLGKDAIWSHRNSLVEDVYYGKNTLGMEGIGIRDYVIVPQDMGIGVMSHEYGHILGLKDEYNIHNNEKASPVGYWSIMASGGGSGISYGTDPIGFSPWCKQYLQKTIGGNWVNIREVDLDDIEEKGIDILLDEASKKGINHEVIRINLPKDTLSNEKDRYYLLEWRNNSGTDRSLVNCEGGPLNYDSGLVIWYIDENYSNSIEYDNNVAKHPGYGFIGVVDADQHVIYWRDEKTNEIVETASSDYQIHDAAFRLKKGRDIYVSGILNKPGLVVIDKDTFMKPIFDDSRDYSNEGANEAGRILPKHGLKIYVTGQSSDGSVGKIHILKNKNFVYKNNILNDEITSSFIRNITLDKDVIEKDDKSVITLEVNGEKIKDEIVICYCIQENGKEEEKYLNLKNVHGKYVGEICKDDDFKIGNWKIKYIVIENENEDAEIIYNAYTNEIVSRDANREDLSGGDISVVEKEEKGLKIENTTKATEFVLGESAEIAIKALNEGVAPKEITLIAAVYDSNNMLVKYSQNNEIVKFTEHKDIKTILDLKEGISDQENYTIKVFMWDNLQEVKPLMNYFVYNTVSMKTMEKDGVNKFREAMNPENIRTLLESELEYIEIDLEEYIGLSEELKGCVAEKIFNKKDEIVSKESLQNIIGISIIEVKLEQYKNATTSSIIGKVLESEPNILGVDTEEYKKLNQDIQSIICTKLIEKQSELNSKETIQEFLNAFIEEGINIENVRKTMEDFNDYMYNTWFIDASNINYAEKYLNSVIEALKKLDSETKNRYENNDEYKNNKEKIEKAREIIELTNEMLAQFQKSESEESMKALLENSDRNLGVNLSEYKKLDDKNKLIVIKDLYDSKELLTTKDSIEKIIKESISKIEMESMDIGVIKYMKCENEMELKNLLDTIPNELKLETHLYNKMNEDDKNYVAGEVYKYKDKFNSKESIQDKLDEVVADTILSALEEEYMSYYDMEGEDFVKGMESLFNYATEALEKIGNPHSREIIKSKYMSYEEISSKLKEIKSSGVTKEDFKIIVDELQDLIMNEDIEDDEVREKANQLIEQGEKILKALKEMGEYNSVDAKLLTVFEQSKGFL